MTEQRLRLIAGELGGRRIRAAEGSRPTQERVREALFSRWGGLVPGTNFLDLFCGGGAVGLEALSRGASATLFVDADGRRLDVARRNAESLGVLERCAFVRASLPAEWARIAATSKAPVVAFADPPYDFADYEGLAGVLQELDGLRAMAMEHSVRTEWTVPWTPALRREYGESALTLCELPEEQS